ALGGSADLHEAAAGHAFDLYLIESVLRFLQLVLGVLRCFEDRAEVGHFGHVRSLSWKKLRVRNQGTRPSPRGRWNRRAHRRERAPQPFSPGRAAKVRPARRTARPPRWRRSPL